MRDLDAIERAVRHYWSLEFNETRFPTSLFNAFLVLSRAMGEGASAVALAHLLRQYLTHLEAISRR